MSKPLCLVVGMGPGISYSTARKFGTNGFKLVMVARKESSLEEFQKQFSEEGIDSVGIQGNAGDFKSLRRCLDSVKKVHGIPDILIYNVSVYRENSPSELRAEDVLEDFKANVCGALISVQAFVEEMKERKSGTIFFTGGGQGIEPDHFLSSLGIGKAAIRNLSFSFQKELKPFNIRVGTLTVNGMVAKNTAFDPEIIANKYWELYNSKDGKFKREVLIN